MSNITFIKFPKRTKNSFSGENTVNKPIAHGLGVKPKLVVGVRVSDGATCLIIDGFDEISYLNGNTSFSVTTPDTINFYVGNATNYAGSMNGLGHTWHWIAFE